MTQIKNTVLLLLSLSPLGCSSETEVFDKSAAALEQMVGADCSLSAPPGEGEVMIEHPEVCGDAVCLGVGDAPSSCSCRCSGPDNGLPLCDCPDSFHCVDDLILEIQAGNIYAGGYCVAD